MDDSSFFTLDDSLWPLVVIRLRGKPTDEEYTQYLQVMTNHLERDGSRLVVLDMLQARFSSTEHIRQQSAWMARHQARLRECTLGSGFVVASSFIQLGMRVIFHLNPPFAPYFISTHETPVVAWGAQRLEEAGFSECAERIRQRYALHPSLRTA